MGVITLRVNGVELAVPAGSSVLTATRQAGAQVPVLCHLDGLNPIAACRLCLVEIEGSQKLQPACSTEASEGMVVKTDSDQLQQLRRMAVELLFSEGNHVCAFCVASGACELQNVAVAVGMDHSRFPYQYPHRPVDASHHLFSIDHNRCILCSRCVRVCDEIEGAHVWDVANRGGESRIVAGLNQPWGEVESCTSCGKCVDVCPTGAIFHKEDTTAEKHPHAERAQRLRQAREQHQWHHP